MISTPVRILIVEDDFNLQNMYHMKFDLEGFDVKVASNGKEGFDLCKTYMPDMVLLDLRMPIMSGEEMLTKLRSEQWGSDVRVIVLTNISKNEAPQSLRFLNVDQYIVKAHSTPAQIVAVVKDILGLDLK